MRFLITILTASVAAGACNRDVASASVASNSTAAKPVATSGGDAAPATRPEAGLHEVTIPAGTQLPIVLDTGVGSSTSRAEHAVHAQLARNRVVHGQTVRAERTASNGVR